ncbi:MAG: hypothetical protein CMG74_10615 [Candidatus Marinimicrobia bacterium]|nr:hypothetical protein [Candidatus Neomarinimicrobiota bacterium]|tara:strand:+ start:10862 stop:12274 length:1413 start_codon:yes stop_codon:yes gene_type:complete
MDFTQFESIMSARGARSLAEIARSLETTPQAVSNWKARNQVPYHIVDKINKDIPSNNETELRSFNKKNNFNEGNNVTLSDFLLTLAEQLKIIFLIPFITVFSAFTFMQFIQTPLYKSTSTILLPENQSSSVGLMGLASQFGVSMPQVSEADLSSPSLFPELIKSRVFAERILKKEFYSKKYDKKLPLLAIINDNEKIKKDDKKLVLMSLGAFFEKINFENKGSLSNLTVIATEPQLSKNLNKEILNELESLNRYFKNQNVSEKINFINQRINSVDTELKESEQRLKLFRQQNLQLSSPALQLTQDRLTRNVEVQKGVYLTLKQQLELAKIEEVQKTKIVQILDEPELPLGPYNKNLSLTVILAGVFGLVIGIFLGFIRAYFNSSDIYERKKLRRMRSFINKKSKEILMDTRISGTISLLLIFGLPFYLGHQSSDPVFFGMYSPQLLLINIFYIISLLLFSCTYFFSKKQK